MRNLKRILSLALASVMLMGMMVIGAGAADKTAADLTDMDKVTNKEAVSLMVDLGVIVGKPDGSYAPTEGVDRATMAKLITYVLMGDVDATIFEGTTTDLTDIDSSWAEGYIKYCYSNGIISGDGLGHFFPTQGVTVVQAAKMLLVALGYESDDRGYAGNANWSTNIMRDAQTSGLMAGINAKATDTLTRDGAAQMIFNALFANTVTPKYAYDMGVQYVTEYTKGNTLGYNAYGLVKVTATVNGLDANGNAVLTNIEPDVTGMSALVSGKIAATPDVVGTSVVLYVKGTLDASGKVASVSELYSTSLATGTTAVLGTSTNGTALADLANKSNKSYIATIAEEALFFLNGSAAAETDSDSDKLPDDMETAAAKKGAVVEFIDSKGDGMADIVKITEKTVDFVTGNVTTRTKDGVLQVNIPGVLTWTDASLVSGYEDLANGDVVLTVPVGTVTYIEKAAVVEGTISSRNSDKTITVNGVKYAVSDLKGTNYELVAADKTDFVNTYTFYLDNGSNIVSAKQVTEETADQYAVVLDIVYIEGTVSAGTTAKGYAEAQVLYTDGTTEVKKVASINSKTPVLGNDENAGTDAADNGIYISDKNTADALENAFYTYSLDKDNALVLTSAADSTKTVSGKIESGKPQFSDGTAIGNSATVFLVKANNKYSVYTGIANLPNGTAGSKYDVIDGTNGIVSYVYVEMTVSGTEATDYAFVTSTVFGTSYDPDSKETTYIFNAVVNGEETTIAVNATAKETLKKAAGLYTVTYTDDVVTAASKVTGKAITAVGGGVLQLADTETVYTYDADTVVYLFEDNALTSVGTGDDLTATPEGYTDSVSVATVSAGSTQLAVVYIVRTAD